MAKTNFQKSVDAAKESIDSRNSKTEKADLELVLPIVGVIMQGVGPAVLDVKYAIDNLDPSLPLVAELNQCMNVMSFTLSKAFKEKTARLAELNGSSDVDGDADLNPDDAA